VTTKTCSSLHRELVRRSETTSVAPREHTGSNIRVVCLRRQSAWTAQKCLLMPDEIFRQPCEWAEYIWPTRCQGFAVSSRRRAPARLPHVSSVGARSHGIVDLPAMEHRSSLRSAAVARIFPIYRGPRQSRRSYDSLRAGAVSWYLVRATKSPMWNDEGCRLSSVTRIESS
jgi:hypothetical protein